MQNKIYSLVFICELIQCPSFFLFEICMSSSNSIPSITFCRQIEEYTRLIASIKAQIKLVRSLDHCHRYCAVFPLISVVKADDCLSLLFVSTSHVMILDIICFIRKKNRRTIKLCSKQIQFLLVSFLILICFNNLNNLQCALKFCRYSLLWG